MGTERKRSRITRMIASLRISYGGRCCGVQKSIDTEEDYIEKLRRFNITDSQGPYLTGQRKILTHRQWARMLFKGGILPTNRAMCFTERSHPSPSAPAFGAGLLLSPLGFHQVSPHEVVR